MTRNFSIPPMYRWLPRAQGCLSLKGVVACGYDKFFSPDGTHLEWPYQAVPKPDSDHNWLESERIGPFLILSGWVWQVGGSLLVFSKALVEGNHYLKTLSRP